MSPVTLPGMTVQEALDDARARCAELGVDFPGTTSLLVRRMSQMQQRVYAVGAQWNPDYFGRCVIGTLDGGAIDLLAIADPLTRPETITRIEIADAGSSDKWAAGQEVYPVPLSDMAGEMPPRVTVRQWVISSVGTDLTGVTSLRIYYSPTPLPLSPTALGDHLGVPSPHDAVVPLDLTLYLLDKLPAPSDAVVAGRAQVEKELAAAMTALESHVRSYVMTMSSRFGSRPHAPPMRITSPQPPTV